MAALLLTGSTDAEPTVYEDVQSDEDITAVLSPIKNRWLKDLRMRHTGMSAHDRSCWSGTVNFDRPYL